MAALALIPTAMTAVAVEVDGGARWRGLLAWWKPWSDASLFSVLMMVVHHGLYFGKPLLHAQAQAGHTHTMRFYVAACALGGE